MAVKSKYIVITTINNPNEAIRKFSGWDGWQLVVIGDRKTPLDWHCNGAIYLGIEEQYKLFGDLAHAIPENTYTRKVLGYVYAIQHGATAIFESDDDNIPYADASTHVNRYLEDTAPADGAIRLSNSKGWINIYDLFGAPECWPRGFPIQHVKDGPNCIETGRDNKPWALTQFLADEDPDVDAIYRMVGGSSCYFAREKKFILDAGTYCPFNSQATLWTRETFPLLFLPLGVFDRVTDILRSYIATTALWKMSRSVLYASPIVFQKRNTHNLHEDFVQEIPLYVNTESWCRQLSEIEASNPIEFYRTAINVLDACNTFSLDNAEAYELFLKSSDLI